MAALNAAIKTELDKRVITAFETGATRSFWIAFYDIIFSHFREQSIVICFLN